MTPAVAPAARGNAALVALMTALALLQLLVVPVVLLPASPHWGWLLALPAAATLAHWALIHEAIHGLLFANRAANDRAGRLLAVLWGAPLRPLRIGHLLHHRHSRSPRERAEVHDPAARSWAAAASGYYARLLGGVYAMEVAALAAAFVPRAAIGRLARRLDRPDSLAGEVIGALAKPAALAETRADAVVVLLAFGAAFAAYGTHGWMLLAALAARAVLASLADNAFHYGTRLDAPRHAIDGTLPRWASALWLHFNLHGVHHREPALPWHALPRAFEAAPAGERRSAIACLLRQLRGPLSAARLRG